MVSTTDVAPARQAAMPGRARAWAVTAMLVALMMINFADKSVLGLAAGPLSRELGLTASEYGRVASAFYLLFSVSAVVTGFLATRLRSTVILGVLAALWSIAVAPVLVFASLPALYAGRVLLGAAEGPTAPLVVHGVQKWFLPRDRSLPVGLTQLGGSLGIIVVAPPLGWLIEHHGWRSAFVAVAVAGLVWLAGWLVIGREGPHATYRADLPDGDTTADAGPAAESNTEKSVPYRRLFLNGTWLGTLAIGSAAYWSLAVSVAWLPRYLEDIWKHDAADTGRLVTLPAFVSGVLLVLVPWLSGRRRRRGASSRAARGLVAAAACAVSGLALLGAARAESASLALLCVVIGFGVPNVVFPLGFLNIAEIAPVGRRAMVLSVGTAIASLTGVIAPTVTGDMVQAASTAHAGFGKAFTLAAVLLLVAAVAGALLINPGRDARRLGLVAPQPGPSGTAQKEESR
ncbi:MFS transporter [Streptomyces sp. NBC_00063]|uniref:MFS transporter n=1 Tax=Streptomyces sp. NBC_00063 TaxID=2975638 RepID=UPI003D71131E